MSVTDVNTGNSDVLFQYRDDGSSNSYSDIDTVSADSADISSSPWDLADPGSGEYQLRAVELNDTGGEVDGTEDTVSITVDNSAPSISSQSPDNIVSEDNPNIEASFEDSLSDLQNASISFEGETREETDIGSSSQDVSIDGSDYDSLDDGSHTVDYEAYDEAGNRLDDSWSFTVDTEYDGDSNPDFWVEKDSDEINDGYFDFEDDVELVADFGDADSESDTTVSCMIEGEEIDTFTVSAGDDDPDESDTTCDIDYDEDEPYYDSNAEIYLEMEDEAGNSDESDTEELGFDSRAPSISEFESSSGVSVFNEDFDMSYESFDSVSGVNYVDYSVGDGDSVQLDDSSGNFTVDTSSLEQGSYEVQAQAVDNVGKVSDERTFEFDFYPDEVPELTLEGETELNVTSGSEETLELNLENTGRILVPEGEVTGSENFVESASYGDVAPGESETLDIVFSPENGLGEYTVNLQASTVDASHSVDVLVRADNSEQDEIDEEVQNYRSNLNDLSSRVEELKSDLSQERKERIDSDFEEFQSQVSEAEQAVEDGRYYEADEILSNLNSSRQSAESTFEAVKSEHETAMRNRYILAGLFFVLILFGGGAGFILYSDEYEIDVESLSDFSIGGENGGDEKESSDSSYSNGQEKEEDTIKSALTGIKERVDDMRNSEEKDDPEYKFK